MESMDTHIGFDFGHEDASDSEKLKIILISLIRLATAVWFQNLLQ